jgi:hypothetical protein
MFEAGTKFITLASSVDNSKLGPKRGSIGYFINQSDLGGNVLKETSNGYLVECASAVFTRYGFEKKKRSEVKKFISLYPAIPNLEIKLVTDTDKLKKIIIDYMKEIEKGKARIGDYSSTWFHNPTPGLLIFPIIDSTNLITAPYNEFKAWFKAVTHSGCVANMLASYYQKFNKNITLNGKEISRGVISTIINSTENKKSRETWIERLKNPENVITQEGVVNREDIILTVAFINLLIKRHIMNETLTSIVSGQFINPVKRIVKDIPSIVQDLETLERLKEALKSAEVKKLEDVIFTIKEVTSVLGAFSSPLLREGKEYPYKESKEIKDLLN